MQRKADLSKTLRYQKTACDNAFSIFTAMQQSSNDMLRQTLDMCGWIGEKEKKTYLFLTEGAITATENLKILIDNGYEEAERHFSNYSDKKPAGKTTSKATPKKTKSAAPAATAKNQTTTRKTTAGAKKTPVAGAAPKKTTQKTTPKPEAETLSTTPQSS